MRKNFGARGGQVEWCADCPRNGAYKDLRPEAIRSDGALIAPVTGRARILGVSLGS